MNVRLRKYDKGTYAFDIPETDCYVVINEILVGFGRVTNWVPTHCYLYHRDDHKFTVADQRQPMPPVLLDEQWRTLTDARRRLARLFFEKEVTA